jgi:N-acetylneuraminic acid mutarotase
MNAWPRRASIFIVTATLVFGVVSASGREVSFAERLRAQEALERARYAHQEGTTIPFEEAVPHDLLRNKVALYLGQSAALETLWNTPLTAAMLERELARIAARTRMPDRLAELFAALGGDSVLIQECLVRPVLVDRLARERFASDAAIHARALAEAVEVRDALATGALDPSTEHPARRVGEIDAAEVERDGEVGPVRDEGEVFLVQVTLEEDDERAVVARYVFPKRTWDDWWAEASPKLDIVHVRAVADGDVRVPAPASADKTRCVGERWEPGALDDLPEPRRDHTAVWTGTEMLVWGGSVGAAILGSMDAGFRYDPSTDSWTSMSTIGDPSSRSQHAAVWTGQEMIIWGHDNPQNSTGGRYNPVSDTWTATSVAGAPAGRSRVTAVWTGTEAIFWGGENGGSGGGCDCCFPNGGLGCNDSTCEDLVCGQDSFCCNVAWDSICAEQASELCGCCGGQLLYNSGGRYDPASDTWTPTSLSNAPQARSGHTAIWTGTEMVVWGGGVSGVVASGGRYDPVSDSWTATNMAGAPAARAGHTAVWTGSQMVVWGGSSGSVPLLTGGRYDPVANAWSPTTITGTPPARWSHTAVWSGSEMIVWGGGPTPVGQTGGRYDPEADTWAATSTAGAPVARTQHTMVWTGSEAIVWGGDGPSSPNSYVAALESGGRYDPDADAWTPTFTTGNPHARYDHTAVWTGNLMIVWGGGFTASCGDCTFFVPSRSGGRYDPTVDLWSPTSTAGAPAARSVNTTVWTGNTMIVWGGELEDYSLTATGGRYDPVADAWTQTTLTGAPSGRSGHTAVWAGNRMIVWGGNSSLSTGGRYDPSADAWTATSTTNAPSGRSGHTAVWTGTRMVVWGGGNLLNTGGRYNLATNTWSPTSQVGAPVGRTGHTAVWTGTRMVLWGGRDEFFNGLDSGGRYDPTADTWLGTSTIDAPVARHGHTAVWSGDEMIVWGGDVSFYDYLPTGGRYDPAADEWLPTPLTEAPSARSRHTAVWTGDHMLVWGGGGDALANGGSYAPETDADGDGAGCSADCNDADPGSFAIPSEVSQLNIAGDKVELQWRSATGGVGLAMRYDIVRGSPAELPVGSGGSEMCLESDYAPSGIDPTKVKLDDPEVPDPGAAFWYLVRATNGCGIGTYGATSGGEERVSASCP